MKDVKLAIALPLADNTVYTNFMLSVLGMSTPDYTLIIPNFPHMHLDAIRCNLVAQAKAADCTHIIMLDTDQQYNPDTVQKLLLNKDKDVVTGLVHRRYPPYAPILYRGKMGDYEYVSDDEMFSGDLVEVDATGTGCMMIAMEVFDDIEQPYFEETTHNGKTVGEDIYFCNKVRSAGRKIYVDTSIQVKHISLMSVDRAVYELYKRGHGIKN